MWRFVALLCLPGFGSAWYYGRPDPGAFTRGGVWPLPKSIQYESFNHTINPGNFRFATTGCDIVDRAAQRYAKLAFPFYNASTYSGTSTITTLTITVSKCTDRYPQLESDESCLFFDLYRECPDTLRILSARAIAYLEANEAWGAIRGLETFAQLVFYPQKNQFYLRSANVTDQPRFAHRGILVDTGRHFISTGVLRENIDIMAQNKMNVFHWHIVDSESFPYSSTKFPDLSAKGAYTPIHRYSVQDIKDIIDYAADRGVRVVPEFDTPGHMGGWGAGGPTDLLAKCYTAGGQDTGLRNILDPTLQANLDFIRDFFTEALSVFPDNYLHFGGDEVLDDMNSCWSRNPDVIARMQTLGFGTNTSALLNYYFHYLFTTIDQARNGTKKVVWQEVLDQNVDVKESIAHVWKGNDIPDMQNELNMVTQQGHKTILSTCWYLNYIKYGPDWGYVNNDGMFSRGMYYECDPQDFPGTQAQKDLVIGGEAAMWGEYVDGAHVIDRLWPRASAVAERLWSDAAQTKDPDAAWPRLHEQRCRLLDRGHPVATINSPDYCPFYWDPQYTGQ